MAIRTCAIDLLSHIIKTAAWRHMQSAYKLPISFDPDPIAAEVAKAESRSAWIDHWADTSAIPGTWVFIPLIAGPGDLPDAIRSERDDAPRSMPLLAELPHSRSIIDAFHTKVMRARLMKLKAGAVIKEHRDYAYFGGQRWSFERGRIRVHIPIITGANVFWMLNGKRIDMKAGEAWYVNVCRPHSVENRGDIDRIHLVLETEVNEWLRSMFPPETLRDRLWGTALRNLEPLLWNLYKSIRA
jgi:mannose-6-phosphate isomerase-like protein (cupin superfamily)